MRTIATSTVLTLYFDIILPNRSRHHNALTSYDYKSTSAGNLPNHKPNRSNHPQLNLPPLNNQIQTPSTTKISPNENTKLPPNTSP